METLGSTKERFVQVHEKDLGAVLAQRTRINALLAKGVKHTRASGASEVCIRVEFQVGYEGHDIEHLKDRLNILRHFSDSSVYDEAIGMEIKSDTESELAYDEELFVIGQGLRSIILGAIDEKSTLRQTYSDS